MTPSDSTLNQILATLTSLGERLAVVEADLKTVIRDHTKDLDDHEMRLRVLEATAREVVTRTDLEQSQRDTQDASNRRANLRLGLATLVLSVVVVAVNVVMALV